MKKFSHFRWIAIFCTILISLTNAVYAFADSGLTAEKLKNAEYYVDESGLKVKFNDGSFESTSSEDHLNVAVGEVAFGDLNNDGLTDAAVILVSSGGGSGVFYDLAIVLNKNGRPEHITSQSLGDRIQLNSITIKASEIVVDSVGFGPSDPMCCPSEKSIIRYKLSGDKLLKVASNQSQVSKHNDVQKSSNTDDSKALHVYVEPFKHIPENITSMYTDPDSIKLIYGLWYLGLKTLFVIPDFDIHFKYCKEKSGYQAYFDGSNINICNEYTAKLVNQKLDDALPWTFFHEVGHALPYFWDDPLCANEDAADEFATAILLMMDDIANSRDLYKKTIEASIKEWKTHGSFFESLDKIFIDDRHSVSVQRARNISNWFTNSETLKRQWFKKLAPHMQTKALKEMLAKPMPWMDTASIKKELRGRGTL